MDKKNKILSIIGFIIGLLMGFILNPIILKWLGMIK